MSTMMPKANNKFMNSKYWKLKLVISTYLIYVIDYILSDC